MNNGLLARATARINAPVAKVWDALVNPAIIRQYMFGAHVDSDWKEGSRITWKGEWQGKAFEDKGQILRIEPGRRLQYTHYSPLAGQPDVPESYHTVTIDLSSDGKETGISLTQDNNATQDARQHSESNWNAMLSGLKKLLEQ